DPGPVRGSVPSAGGLSAVQARRDPARGLEDVQVEDVRGVREARAARRRPGHDVLLGVLVVDQAQPDRPAPGATALGGGLHDDHVALLAGVQAVDGPYGGGALQAGAQPRQLGRVVDAGDLLGTAAAAPADADGGPGDALG